MSVLWMKNVSFPHVTNIYGKTVFHNCGKVWKIHILWYLSHFIHVYKCLFHFFNFMFSPVFKVFHSVNKISTFYPLLKICGNMWKTINNTEIIPIFYIYLIVEKKDIHNFHVDFVCSWHYNGCGKLIRGITSLIPTGKPWGCVTTLSE